MIVINNTQLTYIKKTYFIVFHLFKPRIPSPSTSPYCAISKFNIGFDGGYESICLISLSQVIQY
jgi:hypothetical protein